MGGVGDDAVARINQSRIQTFGGESGGDDLTGENLAVGSHQIGSAWGQFANCHDAAQEFIQRFEVTL